MVDVERHARGAGRLKPDGVAACPALRDEPARIALHVRVIYGRDPHHICEAQYKAIARALREAVEPDPRVRGIPSTKGVL